MSRRTLLVYAAIAAILAAAVTFWFSSDAGGVSEEARRASRTRNRHLWRTGRLAFVPEIAEQAFVPHPRIVAIAPGIAQIVRDLGCAHLLVGRHSADEWSDPHLRVCCDPQGIDYENLLAAHPTHVFLQWGDNPIPPRLSALAIEKGWTVVNIPLLKLDDITHAVNTVHATIKPQELDALRWERAHTATDTPDGRPSAQPSETERNFAIAQLLLLQRFEAALVPDETLADAGRILLLYQGDGEQATGGGHPAALGPGSYHHDLLLRLGGRSAIAQGQPFMPLDAEDIARLKPDAIIIVRPRSSGAAQAIAAPTTGELLASLGVVARLSIPAVKNNRIAIIDEPMSLIPGTNMAEVADHLRAILTRWAISATPDSR